MLAMKPLSNGVWASRQIDLEDAGAIAEAGVKCVISNRPDGEEYGQPTAEEVRTALAKVGVAFIHAPARGMPDQSVVDAVGRAMDTGEPLLLFCKSGKIGRAHV